MDDPIRRLRAADPAASLPDRPDAEGEAGLRMLLDEPRSSDHPERAAPPSRARARIAPALVTGIVAVAVVAIAAAVLVAVQPRTREAAEPTPTASTIAPPYTSGSCRAADVAPFECGTYRSVYGAPSVTGDTGGPAEDPMSLSFSTDRGVLLLTAVTKRCFAGSLPVRYDGKRLVPAGEALFGEYAGCDGPGRNDRANWAHAFLTGPLEISGGGDLLAFDLRTAMVTFEYQGAAGIGEPQLPRTETTCVPAHVDPFGCGTYRSTAGTGSLAFLGTSPYRLRFAHLNGELTASFIGDCNAMGVSLQPERTPAGATVFAIPGATTQMGCPGMPEDRDDAVSRFFRGELAYRITGDRIVFSSGSTSATFRR